MVAAMSEEKQKDLMRKVSCVGKACFFLIPLEVNAQKRPVSEAFLGDMKSQGGTLAPDVQAILTVSFEELNGEAGDGTGRHRSNCRFSFFSNGTAGAFHGHSAGGSTEFGTWDVIFTRLCQTLSRFAATLAREATELPELIKSNLARDAKR